MEKDKTALVLGGGGSRGAYEIGVWQALRELDIKIDIITGTSVGAINGAIIAQNDFDNAVQIWKKLETDRVVESGGLENILKKHINERKIRESNLDFGVVTTEFPSLTPHFLFKENIPEGKLCDYIIASASCFPALKIHEIDGSKFMDGAYNDNLPVGMALEKGAKLVIAVDLEAIGIVDKKKLKQAKYLKVITSPWNLGGILIFERKNTERIMRLGYLETMKALNVFDGFFYTFPKNEFDKKMLKCADAAAKIFELDPLYIYKDFILDGRLRDAINSEARKNRKQALAVTISKTLDQPQEKNVFLSKPALALLNEVILAATYIYKRGLTF